MQQQFAINYSALGDLGGDMEFAGAASRAREQILCPAGRRQVEGSVGLQLARRSRACSNCTATPTPSRAAIDEAIDLSGDKTGAAAGEQTVGQIKARALFREATSR